MDCRPDRFWLDEVLVDIDRSQLDDNGRIIPLEPKVIAVLQLLAERAGEVVSYEAIAERVWPDVVVAPSSLQRSIALLRKALGDSAKEQRLIVTHPKKGYSLAARIRWPAAERPPAAPQSTMPEIPAPEQPVTRVVPPSASWRLALSLLVLLGVLLLGWYQWPAARQHTGFSQLTPLTATDESENFVSVSADGRYIAYNRDFDGYDGHIVLKALADGREWVLTDSLRSLRGPTFSPDGKYLTYASLHMANNQKCSRLNLVDLDKARLSHQPPQILLHCDPHSTREMVFHSAPVWLSNNRIALIRASGRGNEVISLDLHSGHQQSLYSSTNEGLYALAYSPKSQHLLIVAVTLQNKPRLLLMNGNDHSWRELPLTLPEGISDWFNWRPSWHPDGERLILAAGRQLFELSLDGRFTPLSMLTLQQLADPHYLPDGRRMIAVQGIADWDIMEHRWPAGMLPAGHDTGAAPIQEPTDTISRHRSNLRENEGQFQPGGTGIAFLSNRSGNSQLWYGEENNRRRLSHLDDNRPVEAFLWSPDGQSLVFQSAEQLFHVDLQGQHQPLPLNDRPVQLYQWQRDGSLLFGGVRDGQSHILRYDFARQQTDSLYQGHNYWAQIASDTLFYGGAGGQLYRLDDRGPVRLAFLDGTKLQWRFFARGNKLYLQDKQQRFWRYDPHSDTARLLHYYHDESKFITDYDADRDRILTEYRVSDQSEIVMLE